MNDMKQVDLNYYFRADSDVIYVESEEDFKELCSEFLSFEGEPHVPVHFSFNQEILGEETVMWRGVFELDDNNEMVGICSDGRLSP